MASKIKKVQAAQTESESKLAVLGTFEGECADSNITNLNGLDITRPVWEAVFSSEEYAKGIECGWYIGFLGHPEGDPGCQDFEHACIVMREGHIADDGKVYGKFDLIDTPVGRIVKAFQDAGVVFGISVRGAGDIVDNSVDPDTFVFRGFDLVAFPAYPNAVPTFTQIAASTDVESRKKYQRVCAAVSRNIKQIDDVSTLNVIQSQFASQSKTYAVVAARKAEILESDSASVDLSKEKLSAMTELYLNAVKCNTELNRKLEAAEHRAERKFKRVRAIMSSQLESLQAEVDDVNNHYQTVSAANRKLKDEAHELHASNLKYTQDIQASRQLVHAKDSELRALKSKLAETVSELDSIHASTSNLGAEATSLRKQLVTANRKLADAKASAEAIKKQLNEYQVAYVQLYAHALGVDPSAVRITASTRVSDLRNVLEGSSSTSSASSVFASTQLEDIDPTEFDSDDLVTM